MKLRGAWLERSETQHVLALLEKAGHQAYVVGGCVRNALLNAPVADIDIATDARPERVIAIAKAAGVKSIPTGIEHGTVTLVENGIPFEITTFRRDVDTDGRRAVVAFATDIAEDAQRRDLTMNALYARADGSVLDPTGEGIPDTLARRLRFVGDAATRIREDYLRILRFFRFYAWYGDPAEGIDPDTLAACAANADGLAVISRERIGGEMKKLLAASDPAPAVAIMAQACILGRVLPGADLRALAPLIWLEAGLHPDWLRRLAVIGGDDVAANLRLSRQEKADLGHIRDEIGTGLGPAALGWKLGAALARDTVLARSAVLEMPMPEQWQDAISRGAQAVFPVRAEDLMPALSGPALGQRLRALEARWLQSDLRLSRAELLG